MGRVAGDTWMEDCNRCRCTENLLPGCTKRFCNIPGLTGEKPLPGGPVETRKSSNEGGDNVNFPGVGDSSRGQPVTQCADSLGNKRSPGESWKDDCNTCGCGTMDLSCVLLPFAPLHQSSAQIIKAIREIQEIDGMKTATHVGAAMMVMSCAL